MMNFNANFMDENCVVSKRKLMEQIEALMDKLVQERFERFHTMNCFNRIRIPRDEIFVGFALTKNETCELAEEIAKKNGFTTKLNGSSLWLEW